MILLSPAKKLSDTKPDWLHNTAAMFWPQSMQLVTALQDFTAKDLGTLMHLSSSLASLNYQRFQDFNQADSSIGTPALFAFHGDVYKNLDAASLDRSDCNWAQDNLLILSGLYGCLRPFDAIQPYRLEMGTKWGLAPQPNLYTFWQDRITQYLNAHIAKQHLPFIINLSSNEYGKVVNRKQLAVPMLDIVFKEQRPDGLKTIGLMAKRARGAMARYLIQQRSCKSLEAIQQFSQGYRFSSNLSKDNSLVFLSQK
jgi:uncharacterized protein